MSDPQPEKLKPRPPRAEPLQPDKPVSGDDAMARPPAPAGDDKQDALRRGGYPPGKPT